MHDLYVALTTIIEFLMSTSGLYKKSKYFTKQMNFQHIFYLIHFVHKGYYRYRTLNHFGEKMGDEAVDYKMDF